MQISSDYVGPTNWAMNAISDAARTLGSKDAKAVFCTNATLAILSQNNGLRPLDPFLQARGIAIPDHQRIVVKGKTMAIALAADAQVLAYRADVFAKAGVDVPKTLRDIPKAVKALRAKAGIKTPFLIDHSDGWSLAQTFLSHLDVPLDVTASDIDFNTQSARDLLSVLQGLADPQDTSAAFDEWHAGGGAMMLTSGSALHRLSSTLGGEVLAHPLTRSDSDAPATPIWWQGWAIPADQSDEDAQAAFDTMALASEAGSLTADLKDQALWLMDGFTPTKVHEGTLKSVAAGAQPVPVDLRGGFLQAALAEVLPLFMDGKLTVVQTLTKAQSAYKTSARNSGALIDA